MSYVIRILLENVDSGKGLAAWTVIGGAPRITLTTVSSYLEITTVKNRRDRVVKSNPVTVNVSETFGIRESRNLILVDLNEFIRKKPLLGFSTEVDASSQHS